MNIVFLSNYFSHHQKPLSDALASHSNYHFISTADMTEERRLLGWGYEQEPDYVCCYSQNLELANKLLANADVVIAGSAPEKLVRKCILNNQVVFRYSERPLKKGMEPMKYLPRFVRWHWRNPIGKKIYLLCASGFTARDYARFALFRGRAYRWGYFPECKTYENLQKVLESKKKATILWAGRLLDWKHPDDVVTVAEQLKGDGCRFDMRLIGNGLMEQDLQEMINRKGLGDCVHLLGAMTPEQVRRYMEESELFLFTSDRNEGWGAVLNEAMNSGCCVVASDAIGSVPYLLKNGENGFVYPAGNVQALADQVKMLLEDAETIHRMGKNAYDTMREQWNADIAAERLVKLAETILAGEKNPNLYADGPCSLEHV